MAPISLPMALFSLNANRSLDAIGFIIKNRPDCVGRTGRRIQQTNETDGIMGVGNNGLTCCGVFNMLKYKN